MDVTILSPEEWKELSRQAHMMCFGEIRDPSMERIDFAVVTSKDGIPQTYMTCRELDSESVYMQYGGSFPSAKDTIKSFTGYTAMLDHLKTKYLRATTLVENTNTPMLKFAMKAGLLISGVRYFKGSILLEHYIEWSQ